MGFCSQLLSAQKSASEQAAAAYLCIMNLCHVRVFLEAPAAAAGFAREWQLVAEEWGLPSGTGGKEESRFTGSEVSKEASAPFRHG